MKSKPIFIKNALLGIVLAFSLPLAAQTVTPWITKGDQSKLIQQQATVNFAANSGTNSSTITINTGTTYQTMDGFGWCLTQGSAQVISGLAATQQNTLLNDLFNTSTGLSSSVVRISIAASDLSNSSYSYNETAGDTNMNNFSLSGPDLTYLIPILQKIIAINPNIKILATPWSAPRWMKSNNGWVGGSLQTQYYDAYARYFVRYIQAMQAQGIRIWAITPQNEPENPYNEPSMTMNSTEEKNFINNNLGPQLYNAGFGNVRIIAFDHNCDNTAYPTDVLNNSGYVDGAAFHLYAGSISALSTVKNNTGKNIYFTEQYVGGPGNFSGDFGWHMQNVIIGSVNNWAKTAMEWNLATDSGYGPRTPGGCTSCLGAITVNSSTSYTKNSPYYIIGQISKFVKNGAVRTGISSTNGSISAAGFVNNDGSVVVVAYNSSSSDSSTKIVSGSQAFTYTIPGSSAVTFKWAGGVNQGFAGYYNILSRLSGKGLDVANNLTTNAAPIQQYDVTSGGGSNQRWRFESAGGGNYYIRVKSTNKYLAVASNSLADGVKVQQRDFVNNNEFKWTITSLGGGYYKITNLLSGKALDVMDNSTANGGLIQVWAYGGGTNQQWSFTQVENTARMAQPGTTDGEEDMMAVKSFSIYPNPAGNNVTITTEEDGTYAIYGITGNLVKNGNIIKGENSILTSGLSPGYYVVRFDNEHGGSRNLKLMKE